MIGYTRKVGLRKPKRRVPIGLLQIRNDRQAEQVRAHGHLTGYKSVPYDQGGLLGPISRTYRAYATPEPVDPATCPHCCCTYTTECCYCDGSRTPLENT